VLESRSPLSPNGRASYESSRQKTATGLRRRRGATACRMGLIGGRFSEPPDSRPRSGRTIFGGSAWPRTRLDDIRTARLRPHRSRLGTSTNVCLTRYAMTPSAWRSQQLDRLAVASGASSCTGHSGVGTEVSMSGLHSVRTVAISGRPGGRGRPGSRLVHPSSCLPSMARATRPRWRSARLGSLCRLQAARTELGVRGLRSTLCPTGLAEALDFRLALEGAVTVQAQHPTHTLGPRIDGAETVPTWGAHRVLVARGAFAPRTIRRDPMGHTGLGLARHLLFVAGALLPLVDHWGVALRGSGSGGTHPAAARDRRAPFSRFLRASACLRLRFTEGFS